MPKAANLQNREKSERSLGSLFAAARQKRGLPIEKAAHDTRIRIQRLREIEADDFSQFSHPSYARLFLADYGRYLGIPAEEIKHLLPERGECGSEGYQYLQEVTVSAPSYSYTIPRPPKQRRIWPMVATACAIVIAPVIAFEGYILVRNLNRVNDHSAVAKETAPAKAADTTPAANDKTEPVVAAPVVPTEVGVDNAVPAADVVSNDSTSGATAIPAPDAAAVTAAATPAPAENSSPAAAPAVSPEQSQADRALLVGGSTDTSGRVQ